MEFEYGITVEDGPLDFGLCVATGQMFRWHEIAPGRFLGLDGGDAYLVQAPAGDHPLAGARGTGMNRDARRDAHSGVVAEAAWTSTRLAVRSNRSEETFRSLLRLDADEQEVRAAILSRDERMRPYLDATAGLRLLRPRGRVETIFSFVCSANNNLPRITGMVAALAQRGDWLGEVEGHGLRRFPSIAQLASLDESDLRAKGFGYRAASVIATAKTIASRGGEAYLDRLQTAPFADLLAELITWRGVGPKVAECIALFAYDRTEAVPMDTHVWQMLVRLGDAEGSFTLARAKAAAERFRQSMGPFSARAQQALFYDNLLNWRSRR